MKLNNKNQYNNNRTRFLHKNNKNNDSKQSRIDKRVDAYTKTGVAFLGAGRKEAMSNFATGAEVRLGAGGFTGFA